MLISKEWLGEFVTFPKNLSDEKIAQRLSLCTVEVEGIKKDSRQEWDNIVVGEIAEIRQHPNADRLRIVMTRVSKTGDPICIVCGGSNLAAGMKVAAALPGSRVRWHGQGDLVTLGKTVLRGIESNGMICASSEINLADRFPVRDEHEILDLSFLDVEPGTPLAKAFASTDVIFDIDNKSLSNRPDLWGHRGMAREIAAVLALDFKDKKVTAIKKAHKISIDVSVEDEKLCDRYTAVAIEGVAVCPAPDWMQQRLRSCGIRPINVVVDITNYVMLEMGQPMHAFDYDLIKEKDCGVSLAVRRAKKNEVIIALDGKEYSLTADMLVIANKKYPLAIAGVMGGEKSGILDSTSTVVLESAHFNASSIRKTSSALKLSSESSRRFEKHLDVLQAQLALQRAVELYLQLCPGSRVSSAVCDSFSQKEKHATFTLTQNSIEAKLGLSVPLSKAQDILIRLGFGVKKQSSSALRVTTPSFRAKDIMIIEDVIEEILRLYGYEHIPSQLPVVEPRMPLKNPLYRFIRTLKENLAKTHRMHETHNYAFNKPSTLEACGFSLDNHIALLNPHSDERPFVCRSLIPNLLEAVEKNQREHKDIKLFEIARVFYNETIETQPFFLACVFSVQDEKRLFAYAKEIIGTILDEVGYSLQIRAVDAREKWWAQGRSVFLHVNNTKIGSIAAVDQSVAQALGIEREVVACEIDISLLHSLERKGRLYHEQSAYPAIRRDLTCVVEESIRYGDIYSTLNSAHSLIDSVDPFDVYRGPQVENGKKSLSFHITYRSKDRTLTSEEVDKAHIETAALLEKKFNVLIR